MVACTIFAASSAAAAVDDPARDEHWVRWVGVYGDRLLSVTAEGRLQSAPLERPGEVVDLPEAPVLTRAYEIGLSPGPDGEARLLAVRSGRLQVIHPQTGLVELDVADRRLGGRPVGYCPAADVYVIRSGRFICTITREGEVNVQELVNGY